MVFNKEDQIDFKNKLNKIILDKPLRLSIGKQARQTIVDTYNIDLIAGKYKELYTLLKNKINK